MKRISLVLLVLALGLPSPVRAQSPIDLITHALADLTEAKRVLTPPAIVTVPAGGDVQAAVDANPGAVIALTGSYTGTLVLRGAAGGTLTTAGGYPTAGDRMTPTDAGGLAKLRAPGQMQQAVIVEGCNWTLRGLELVGEANELLLFKAGACNLTVDRAYIHGDPATGTKRGVTLNGTNATITRSWIADVKRKGQDAAGIGGWDGPGPYVIRGNYIQASGENILVGGADPSTAKLVPSDIVIADNVLEKDPAWRGQGWTVKNILELKNARRVTITGNTLRGSWTDGQTGFAVMLTIRNQDGACPWCTVEDVTVERNQITDVGAGFNILGTDNNQPSDVMKRVAVRDNTVAICTTTFPGAGRVFQIAGGPQGLDISGNRVSSCPGGPLGMFFTIEGLIQGLVVHDNVFPEGDYGLHAPDTALGKAVLEKHAPGYDWQRNTVVKFPNGRVIPYPAGTTIQ